MRSIICKDGLATRNYDLPEVSFASISGVETGLKTSQASNICKLEKADSEKLNSWMESIKINEHIADERKRGVWLEIEGRVFWASRTNIEARRVISPGEGLQQWGFSFSEMKDLYHSNN